jgi:hypothetical protein
MSPFDIVAVLKKPVKEGVINDRSKIKENHKTETVYLATRDDIESALKARDFMVEDLREKGIEVKGQVYTQAAKNVLKRSYH